VQIKHLAVGRPVLFYWLVYFPRKVARIVPEYFNKNTIVNVKKSDI